MVNCRGWGNKTQTIEMSYILYLLNDLGDFDFVGEGEASSNFGRNLALLWIFLSFDFRYMV